MWTDYSAASAGGQGRERRGAASVHAVLKRPLPACLCACAVALVLSAGCGSTATSPGPQGASEAFLSAHPDPARPQALSTVPATIAGLERQLSARLPVGVPVVLPRELPAGWGLAAPYIAVGSGSALPNPETWAAGYRAAFTDGEALFIVAVNLERLPGKGAWSALPVSIAGRSAVWRAAGETIVLATPPAVDWRVALIGVGVGRSRLETIAAALAEY